MLGLLASVKVHPHLVSDAGLRLRHSSNISILIRWEDIAGIQTRRHDLDRSKTVQIETTESGAVMSLSVLKQTNVDLALREPRPVPLPNGASEPVTDIRFYADDPKALIRKAHELQAS
ncbi:MAG: hypothetical protein M3Q98_01360 [Actinomycetota bacterium]|nr:hypothetical protein [Actinomycetota bacterium]